MVIKFEKKLLLKKKYEIVLILLMFVASLRVGWFCFIIENV